MAWSRALIEKEEHNYPLLHSWWEQIIFICTVIPEYLSIHHQDVSLFWFSVYASSLTTADSMTDLCDTKDLTEQQFTLVQTN